MSLNAKLIVVGGDVKTSELNLRLPSTIGRGRGTSIILPHPLVSRQHCELYEADGQLMVRDLGSLNGTFVNNQRITESVVAPGELLTVGTVTFRAVYETDGSLSSSQGAMSKVPSSEKPIQAAKNTAKSDLKGSDKKIGSPDADDSGPLEFDFGKPAASSASGGPAHVTESLDPDLLEDRSSGSGGNKAASGGKKTAKPAAEKQSAAENPAPKEKQSPKGSDDEPPQEPSSSDEDLNDFLESLNE